jgi:hypothetical protein
VWWDQGLLEGNRRLGRVAPTASATWRRRGDRVSQQRPNCTFQSIANGKVTSHHLLPDWEGAKPRPTRPGHPRPGPTHLAWVVRPVGTTGSSEQGSTEGAGQVCTLSNDANFERGTTLRKAACRRASPKGVKSSLEAHEAGSLRGLPYSPATTVRLFNNQHALFKRTLPLRLRSRLLFCRGFGCRSVYPVPDAADVTRLVFSSLKPRSFRPAWVSSTHDDAVFRGRAGPKEAKQPVYHQLRVLR